jgi:hypothetical protein
MLNWQESLLPLQKNTRSLNSLLIPRQQNLEQTIIFGDLNSDLLWLCFRKLIVIEILQQSNVSFNDNPKDIGHKAMYLLISAKVDEYFQ